MVSAPGVTGVVKISVVASVVTTSAEVDSAVDAAVVAHVSVVGNRALVSGVHNGAVVGNRSAVESASLELIASSVVVASTSLVKEVDRVFHQST